jgi:hypothetical protein
MRASSAPADPPITIMSRLCIALSSPWRLILKPAGAPSHEPDDVSYQGESGAA